MQGYKSKRSFIDKAEANTNKDYKVYSVPAGDWLPVAT